MKKISLILLFTTIFSNAFSQFNKYSYNISGIWKFEISKVYESYMINKINKSLRISFWYESNENAYIYSSPFSYFGFWDTSYYGGENQPKHITELKPNGKFIFFYDDLIHDLSEDDKIGYDSLGNLYRPTRKCDWGFTDDGNGIE